MTENQKKLHISSYLCLETCTYVIFISKMFNKSIVQPLHVFWWPVCPILSLFRGSCCVKMAKNDWKSRFLPPFDLSTTQIFSCVILYIKCLVDQLYNLSICIGCLCDQFLFTFSGGHLVYNAQKWLKLNISCTFQLVYYSKLFYMLFLY